MTHRVATLPQTPVLSSPFKQLSAAQSLSQATWPKHSADEIQAVAEILSSGKTNYWTNQHGRTFEKEFANFLNVRHGIALANGTVALELALYALGIKATDEVIVPSRTFIATASAVVARGASPVVADIDQSSNNITAETINAALTPRTRAVIVVHVGGWPCEMDPILDLAQAKGLLVIEDCAQAHGAKYKGRSVGSFGHCSAFSFCQDKIISTGGEGGLLATNDTSVWTRAWEYKDHGKNYELAHSPNSDGSFRYIHDSFGTNFRMTEMQAAIGRIQLRHLDQWVRERQRNAEVLRNSLSSCPALLCPTPDTHIEHAYYRLYAFINPSLLQPSWSRDRVVAELRQLGIPVGSGSCGEIYHEKAFDRCAPQPALPNAHKAQATSLAFSVHPGMTTEHMEYIGGVVQKVISAATIDSTYPLRLTA